MTTQTLVKAYPEKANSRLNLGERMLARRTELPLAKAPANVAEADLAGDVFWSIFKHEPKLTEVPPAGREGNRLLLDYMMSNPGYTAAQEQVAGNLPAALFSSSLMYLHLSSEEVAQDVLKKQQEAEEAAKRQQEQEAAADAFAGAGMSKEAEEARAEAAKAGAQHKAAVDGLAALKEQLEGDSVARASLMAAGKKAADEGKAIAAEMEGWGMGAGDAGRLDPQEALNYLNSRRGKLARIAQMIGRMKRLALKARAADPQPYGYAPRGAEYAQDLTRIFPEQAARLSNNNHPALRALAIREYLDNGLLSWKMAADSKEAGDFYMLVDESGSMSGAEEIAAKGIALGVAKAAREGERNYTIGSFSSDEPVVEIDSEASWQAHMEWASNFQGGGTDFNLALTWAMDKMEGAKVTNNDLVIITDGDGRLTSDVARRFAHFKEASGTRLFFIPIGFDGSHSTLSAIADKILSVDDVTQDAESVACEIGSWMR